MALAANPPRMGAEPNDGVAKEFFTAKAPYKCFQVVIICFVKYLLLLVIINLLNLGCKS